MELRNEVATGSNEFSFSPSFQQRGSGEGRAIGHHGELLQGAFYVTSGAIKYGLVTFPLRQARSFATFRCSQIRGVAVFPNWKMKAAHAAQLTLNYLGVGDGGGQLFVHGKLPAKYGFGTSTSDVVASIRAVFAAFGRNEEASVVARIAVEAEKASDSIMYDDVVLFAQRDAEVLAVLGPSLPRVQVVGMATGVQGVATDGVVPPRYSSEELDAFASALSKLEQGVRTKDCRAIGEVSTLSASINQHYLPVPQFDRIMHLAADLSAVGIQVAHSGAIAGVLFDPQLDSLPHRMRDCRVRLKALGIARSWTFLS